VAKESNRLFKIYKWSIKSRSSNEFYQDCDFSSILDNVIIFSFLKWQSAQVELQEVDFSFSVSFAFFVSQTLYFPFTSNRNISNSQSRQ
jgi:hypothetical protein